jgi:hypothetical protein
MVIVCVLEFYLWEDRLCIHIDARLGTCRTGSRLLSTPTSRLQKNRPSICLASKLGATRYDLEANHAHQPSSQGSADERPNYRHARVAPIGMTLVGNRQERMCQAWSKVAGRIDRITGSSA